MKKFVVKKNLSHEEQYIFDTVMTEISNFIRFKRDVLIDKGIFTCVEDKGDKK